MGIERKDYMYRKEMSKKGRGTKERKEVEKEGKKS